MRMRRLKWAMSAGMLAAVAVTWIIQSRASANDSAPIGIGSRLELFVDRHLIDALDGAQLKLHPPMPQEIAFHMDAPWEGNYCGYHSLVKDGDRFRYYYRGAHRLQTDAKNNKKFSHMGTCCTESGDAIHWQRPRLGLFDFQGSKDNNIVLKNDSADGAFRGYSMCFMVSLNANPVAKPEERYIALAHSPEVSRTADGKPIGRHAIFTSPDGHRFTMKETPVLDRQQSDGGGDVVFWDTNLGKYVAYLRAYVDAKTGTIGGFKSSGVRSAVRVTSPDLEHWSEPEVVLYGDAPPEDLYTMMPGQYFRAPHIYIGLPTRFMPKRKAVMEWYRDGVNDGVFVTSRDGLHWDRTFMEAFVRPGPDPANWTSRAIYLTRGVVQTGPTEMSVYWYEHGDHGPKEMRVRRGALRLDGFASVNAPYAGGEMVTKPIVFQGDMLVLNCATSAAGSIRVEIQDETGCPIPGFTLEDSPERYGDEIEGTFTWQSNADLGTLAGKPIRLRFVLKDADLYSLRFADKKTLPAGTKDSAVSAADGVKAVLDIPYAGTDNPKQKLDLYLPAKRASDGPLPILAFVHGGAWQKGDKRGAGTMLMPLVQSGKYAFASIGYRLTGEAIWPAQIHDCKAAIRWLRANAGTYDLDPNHIGVMGMSAGGHLVAMLGTGGNVAELEGELGGHRDVDSRVQCVINVCGPTDFPNFRTAQEKHDTAVAILIGGPLKANPDAARRVSPITYVTNDDPPFMCIHGTEDTVVPISQSEVLAQALSRSGVECVMVPITGGGHAISWNPQILDRVKLFFDRHLIDSPQRMPDGPVEALPNGR
jgi:acetyl esterase/lipase